MKKKRKGGYHKRPNIGTRCVLITASKALRARVVGHVEWNGTQGVILTTKSRWRGERDADSITI